VAARGADDRLQAVLARGGAGARETGAQDVEPPERGRRPGPVDAHRVPAAPLGHGAQQGVRDGEVERRVAGDAGGVERGGQVRHYIEGRIKPAARSTDTDHVMYTPQSHPKPGPVREPAPFRIDAEPFVPSGLLLEVLGELDVETTPALRAQLSHALDRGVRRVVIDLSRLDFLDSIAVAALLQIRHRLADHGHLAVVVEPGSYARMVFEIAGLPRSLSVVATRSEALAAVGAG